MKDFIDINLLNYSKCNLLDIDEPSKDYIAAYNTVKWVLLRKISNKPISKQVISNRYEEEYIKLYSEPIKKDDIYWADIKSGRRFIVKLYWLLTKYDVLQPIQSYTSITLNGRIKGEYAIIQKSTKSESPMILMLDYNRPLNYNYLNILECARWYNSKIDYKELGIYHFAMFRGDDWKHKNLNKDLILKWLDGILIQVSNVNNYATPGNYCSECVSKKCLEALN